MTERNSLIINNRHIKYLGISLGLFAYYAGELSFFFWLACALILSLQVRHLTNWFLTYTLLLVSFIAARLLFESSSFENILRDTRFYWGFVIFLGFFISEKRQLGHRYSEYTALFRFMMNLCLVLLLIEFLTSNLLFIEWPNRHHNFLEDFESGRIARAYGFGANASVTSTLLIALGSVLYAGKFMRDIATLVMASSGTGFLAFLLKVALMLKARHLLIALPLFVIFYLGVWTGLLEALSYEFYGAIAKLDSRYLILILDLKYQEFQAVMSNINGVPYIFGQTIYDDYLRSGHNQLFDFFAFNGLFGLGMFVLIVGKCINKANCVPVLLVVTATAHYQVIFSLPGQIIFAWLLTVGERAQRGV